MKEDQRIQEEVNGHTALESSKKDFAEEESKERRKWVNLCLNLQI